MVPNLSDKYLNKVEIINGICKYTDTSNIEEYSLAKGILEGISLNLDIVRKENESTIEISNAIEGSLDNFKIYGNSVKKDASSEVESLGDKPKNLFDINVLENNNYITVNDNGSITCNKYACRTNKTLSQLCPELKVGDIVVLNATTTSYNELTNSYIKLFYLYSGSGSTESEKTWKFNTARTITQEDLDSPVWIYGGKNSNNEPIQGIISNIQIEYSTEATEYEPYDAEHVGKYKIPITVSGKNLLNINEYFSNYVNSENGITYTTSDFSNIYETQILKGKLKTNANYTFSLDYEISNCDNNGISLIMYDVNGTKIGSSSVIIKTSEESGRLVVTNNVNTTISYIAISYTTSSRSCNVKLKNMQIEEGENATAYETYVEPTTYNIYLNEPLRKVENAVDYIDFKRGKIIRNVKEENGVLTKLDTQKIESVNLPDIVINGKTNIVSVGTKIAPRQLEVVYNKEK